MRARAALVLAACWLSAGRGFADGLQIDRAIGKEPEYRTKAPRYGLLALGPKAEDRVWIVLDGDVLYVDRDGDGDLTGPDERVEPKRGPGDEPGSGHGFEVGELNIGGRRHKELGVYVAPLKRYADGPMGKEPEVKAALAEDPEAMAASLSVEADLPGMKGGGLGGRVEFMTGTFQLAGTPAKAPVVRVGGPLQVTFYGDLPTLRAGRETELILKVGAPGIGPGTFAMIAYEETIPEGAIPVATLSRPAAGPGDPPVVERFELPKRC